MTSIPSRIVAPGREDTGSNIPLGVALALAKANRAAGVLSPRHTGKAGASGLAGLHLNCSPVGSHLDEAFDRLPQGSAGPVFRKSAVHAAASPIIRASFAAFAAVCHGAAPVSTAP